MNSLNLKEKTTVLFDLDGTLLPMELEEFTNTYFALLAKRPPRLGTSPSLWWLLFGRVPRPW